MTFRGAIQGMLVIALAANACSGGGAAPTSPSSELSPLVVYDASAEGVSLPTLLREVPPRYPALALAAHIQGTVLVGAIVRADGAVTDVTVLRSADAVFGLDEAAVTAAKQWLFNPGLKDGKPVAVRITIELTFTIRERESS